MHFYDVYKRDASFRTECPRSVEEDGKWRWTKCGADRLRSSQHGALRNLTHKREGGAERGYVLPQQPRRIRPPTLPGLDTFVLGRQPPNHENARTLCPNTSCQLAELSGAGSRRRNMAATPELGCQVACLDSDRRRFTPPTSDFLVSIDATLN
jgi:hypothetical protein